MQPLLVAGPLRGRPLLLQRAAADCGPVGKTARCQRLSAGAVAVAGWTGGVGLELLNLKSCSQVMRGHLSSTSHRPSLWFRCVSVPKTVGRSRQLTDKAGASIGKRAIRLRSLSLAGCYRLTVCPIRSPRPRVPTTRSHLQQLAACAAAFRPWTRHTNPFGPVLGPERVLLRWQHIGVVALVRHTGPRAHLNRLERICVVGCYKVNTETMCCCRVLPAACCRVQPAAVCCLLPAACCRTFGSVGVASSLFFRRVESGASDDRPAGEGHGTAFSLERDQRPACDQGPDRGGRPAQASVCRCGHLMHTLTPHLLHPPLTSSHLLSSLFLHSVLPRLLCAPPFAAALICCTLPLTLVRNAFTYRHFNTATV